MAAVLFGASTPLVQRFSVCLGSFSTVALLYAGAALIGMLPRRPVDREARVRARDTRRLALMALFDAGIGPTRGWCDRRCAESPLLPARAAGLWSRARARCSPSRPSSMQHSLLGWGSAAEPSGCSPVRRRWRPGSCCTWPSATSTAISTSRWNMNVPIGMTTTATPTATCIGMSPCITRIRMCRMSSTPIDTEQHRPHSHRCVAGHGDRYRRAARAGCLLLAILLVAGIARVARLLERHLQVRQAA